MARHYQLSPLKNQAWGKQPSDSGWGPWGREGHSHAPPRQRAAVGFAAVGCMPHAAYPLSHSFFEVMSEWRLLQLSVYSPASIKTCLWVRNKTTTKTPLAFFFLFKNTCVCAKKSARIICIVYRHDKTPYISDPRFSPAPKREAIGTSSRLHDVRRRRGRREAGQQVSPTRNPPTCHSSN